MKKKIKVLIVDDSALIKLLLTEILSNDAELEVVGVASDPYEAREKIKRTQPDVLTLDVEMPKMDGLTFLANLMRLRPMPVVMISTLTANGAEVTLKALELGAFDFVCKPATDVKGSLNDYANEICAKVKAAARSNVIHSEPLDKRGKSITASNSQSSIKLIAIGASTGGTEAIKEVIIRLPTDLPPILITQHIPDVFSSSYAKRLNSLTELSVIEVREKMPLKNGFVYIAPGDDHLFVSKQGGTLYANIKKTELVNRHRPSVDVLFDSVADVVGKDSINVILTGMGSDGAKGMLKLKQTGAVTLAQDKDSSVVWGMPGAAVNLDAVGAIYPLVKIPEAIVSYIKQAKV
ncbi:MAG: chemotaxis response regulator protein-glutamate methylesterase [Gammaproteobacteria bacterium]|nr:chemotaxis response regulator protein-glutamate methylesterase [Gammaproteobacteria bacterium]